MNFIEIVLNNPTDLRSIPTKDIDPFTHDFDSESLPDRLNSLYSVLVDDKMNNQKYVNVIKMILITYKSEINFIKKVNKINLYGKISNYPNLKEEVQKLYSEERNNKLKKIGI